ncbi:MAG: hypothetical protein AB7D05_06795 [Mangrovibacterium sp.]
MEKLLWTKGIFKKRLVITRGGEQIGLISWNSFFGSNAIATLNGRGFILKRDFFLSRLEIQDANNQDVLGAIMINMLNPRSDLVINRKRFELEIKNFWQSRWCWKFNGQEIIFFQSNEMLSKDSGSIEVYAADCEETEILILLGLFVRSQLVLFMLLILMVLILVALSWNAGP